MQHEIKVGTTLIRENACLPPEVYSGESCVAGWKVVKNYLGGRELARHIRKTGWTFSKFNGQTKTTVFGIDFQTMLRKAVEQILVTGRLGLFNSLEVTQVTSLSSKRFPMIRYATVSAEWRCVELIG